MMRQNFIRKPAPWWGKGRQGDVQEIDVVVESVTGKELMIGECKWKNSLKENKTLDTLGERALSFDKYRSYKYLFTKTPVDMKGIQDIVNISVDEYFIEL